MGPQLQVDDCDRESRDGGEQGCSKESTAAKEWSGRQRGQRQQQEEEEEEWSRISKSIDSEARQEEGNNKTECGEPSQLQYSIGNNEKFELLAARGCRHTQRCRRASGLFTKEVKTAEAVSVWMAVRQ